MRIVSDYHDYYDWVQCYGADSPDVYIRRRTPNGYDKQRSTNVENIEFNLQSAYGMGRFVVIGFCGKLYPVEIRLPRKDKEYAVPWVDDIDWYGRDEEITKDFRFRYGKEEIVTKDTYWKSQITNYLDLIVSNNNLLSLFEKKNVPLFVATKIRGNKMNYNRFEVNYAPILKNYDFERIFSAEQTFQEIEYYFGNVLNNRENPDPQITDSVVLRDMKGFNKKSFKNRGKKK